MTSTIRGRGGYKILGNFADGCGWLLVGSSTMETLELHLLFIKVSLVLSLSCQFYYTYENRKSYKTKSKKEYGHLQKISALAFAKH